MTRPLRILLEDDRGNFRAVDRQQLAEAVLQKKALAEFCYWWCQRELKEQVRLKQAGNYQSEETEVADAV